MSNRICTVRIHLVCVYRSGSLDVVIESKFDSSAPEGLSDHVVDAVVHHVKKSGGTIGPYSIDVDSIKAVGMYLMEINISKV